MNAPQSNEKVKAVQSDTFTPLSQPCPAAKYRGAVQRAEGLNIQTKILSYLFTPPHSEVLIPSGTRAERNSTITGLMAISTPFDLIYILLELVYFERFVTNLGS